MKKTLLISLIIISGFVFLGGQTISSLGITASYYDIRSDNAGTIHIIWTDNGWQKYGQIVNRQVVNQVTIPGISWNEISERKFRPRLAVKPDGSEVHFIWVTPETGPRTVRHCWRNSSGTWSVENVFSTSTKYVEYPALTVDSSGVVHAAFITWYDNDGDKHPVHYFRKSGGVWTQQANLAAADAKHLWITLYTDSTGNVHATWDRNKQVIQYRTAASGGNLANSSTVTLPTEYGRNKESELVVDSAGNIHVTAMSYDDPGYYVGYDYWFKPAGGSFQNPVRASDLDFPVDNYFPYPAILGETQNMAVVSWAEPEGGRHQNYDAIRVGIYNGSTWDHITLDGKANMKEWSRTAMANNSTTAYMVWRNETGILSLATFDFATSGVLSPNGGEVWERGTPHEIRWNLENATGNVDINLYKNNVNLGPIASDISNTGSYNWNTSTLGSGTPIQKGNDYQVQVRAVNNSDSDISNAVFTIDDPFALTSPVSSSNWATGGTYNITWTTPLNAASTVKINIFRDSIDVANFVEQLEGPNNGSISWTIADTYAAGNYIIRLKTVDNLLISDSDVFTIETGTPPDPQITVTAPAAGVTWFKGSTYSITWTRIGSQSDNVNIYVYMNSVLPANLVQTLSGANSGSFSWTIPGTYTDGSYIVRVQTADGTVTGDSGLFAISYNTNLPPSMTITSPSSGDAWVKGSTHDITWERTGTLSANVKINIFRNSVDVANFVEQLTGPNSGSCSWTIPGTYTDGNYVIRIKTDDNLVMDDSDVFSVTTGTVEPTITVNTPSAGATLYKGSVYTIGWTSAGEQTANVNIDIYRDSVAPANFVEQITTANDGSHSWTVPGAYTNGNYVIRVETTDAAVYGDSGVFSIAESSSVTPSITIISPNPCSTWYRNTTYTITWQKEGVMSDNVKVNIFRNSVAVPNFVQQLTGPNTGSIAWAIPNDFAGGNYVIRIKTDDNLVMDDSEVFAVSTATVVSPNITVTSPTSCDAWKKGKTYTIAWSKTGSMAANVKINIFRGSIAVENYVEQLTGPNTGSISWTVPGSYTTGTYILRIKTDDNQVVGDSGYFEVED